MKKLTFFTLLLSLTILAKAQVSEGGVPFSKSTPQLKSSEKVNSLTMRKINIEKLKAQDEEMGVDNRYSIYKKKNIDIKKSGVKTSLNEGSLWRYKIETANALSIGLIFSEYQLPEGAKLFIYNEDYSVVYGAFTSKNNKEHGSLAIADFPGNSLYIEYFEPETVSTEGKLVIGNIGQAYKGGPVVNLKSTEDENIGINCEEGYDHQLEKHAVAKMTFESNGSGYLCTGALINNAKNDGTPYFLTANHCLSSFKVANTLVTYFNFEKASCNSITKSGNTLSGAKLKATYDISDVTLLMLDETPPANYLPYYAGWIIDESVPAEMSVGIHHPAGTEKKIAIDYDEIVSYAYEITWEDEFVSPPYSHWLVEFNKGFTEGGSSGSPLFNSQKQIVGQLHGGSGPYDFYGKLSVSWNGGGTDESSLKSWLSPSSNQKEMNGYYPSTNYPEGHFYSDFVDVCIDEPVQFTDNSLFDPTSWTWSFTPSTVTYLEGTNKNTRNPVVSFQDSTVYSVQLKVEKGDKKHTKDNFNYIDAEDILDVIIESIYNDSIICPENFKELVLKAKGAREFRWEIIEGEEYVDFDTLDLANQFLTLSKKDTVSIYTSFDIKLKVIGSHGNCTDSAYTSYHIGGPQNDNINYAFPLELGDNGTFSNLCATVQENEPYPAGGNCNNQTQWCECNISDIIIDNSVWFTFNAPESGIIGINAPGFDNQIAIYDAESSEDILSGDDSKYSIIAANDDYFGEEMDYSALIKGASVVPGKKYWLQVDGSACGASGLFSLELYDYNIAGDFPNDNITIKEEQDKFIVYPNPAKNTINIINNELTGTVDILITNMSVKTIYKISEKEMLLGSKSTFSIPSYITNGFYLITIKGDTSIYFEKLLINR